MRNKNDGTIRIGRLKVRAPGTTADGGRDLATGISRRLAADLVKGPNRPVSCGYVLVRIPQGETQADTVAAATAAIRRRLIGGHSD